MSDNLHLDGEFTLNIPHFQAQFSENTQPDIQADFIIKTVPIIEGSDLIDVEKVGQTVVLTSKTFIFTQAIATDVWVITHNLDKYPSVFAVDSAEAVQIPDDIIYDSNNTVTVKFLSEFSGKAYLN